MSNDYSELDGLFKHGKENPDFATFLSFIQVEYGLDYLKEQWSSFVDFTGCVEGNIDFEISDRTFKDFSEAMKELYQVS